MNPRLLSLIRSLVQARMSRRPQMGQSSGIPFRMSGYRPMQRPQMRQMPQTSALQNAAPFLTQLAGSSISGASPLMAALTAYKLGDFMSSNTGTISPNTPIGRMNAGLPTANTALGGAGDAVTGAARMPDKANMQAWSNNMSELNAMRSPAASPALAGTGVTDPSGNLNLEALAALNRSQDPAQSHAAASAAGGADAMLNAMRNMAGGRLKSFASVL